MQSSIGILQGVLIECNNQSDDTDEEQVRLYDPVYDMYFDEFEDVEDSAGTIQSLESYLGYSII